MQPPKLHGGSKVITRNNCARAEGRAWGRGYKIVTTGCTGGMKEMFPEVSAAVGSLIGLGEKLVGSEIRHYIAE